MTGGAGQNRGGQNNSSQPDLSINAWYIPEPVNIGKKMNIFIKVLDKSDNPVSNVKIKLTPVTGTFLWAAANAKSIEAKKTNQAGLFDYTFQTAIFANLIGGDTPENSRNGSISIMASKEGYADANSRLDIITSN